MNKKLYRSSTNKNLCGVCGGLGEYFDIDPTVVRVIFVLLTLFSAAFPGVIIYIVLALVMPQEPQQPPYFNGPQGSR